MKCEVKYAPQNLNEVIFPSTAVERRIKSYATAQMSGHIILHGPNGTGKTTVANLLVYEIGNGAPQIERLDAEELLAKPDLKSYLKQSAAFAAMTASDKHFMVLNEFDNAKKNLSKFWTALDACGDGVMAIITTNEPMNIHKSIRSRCDVIELPGISAAAALGRVQYCLKTEGLHLPDQQVLHYLRSCEKLMDFRKYFQIADALLALWQNGDSMPSWTRQPKTLRIV